MLCKFYSDLIKIYFQNLAHVEAYIDFSEDENIEKNVLLGVRKETIKLKEQILVSLKEIFTYLFSNNKNIF